MLNFVIILDPFRDWLLNNFKIVLNFFICSENINVRAPIKMTESFDSPCILLNAWLYKSVCTSQLECDYSEICIVQWLCQSFSSPCKACTSSLILTWTFQENVFRTALEAMMKNMTTSQSVSSGATSRLTESLCKTSFRRIIGIH